MTILHQLNRPNRTWRLVGTLLLVGVVAFPVGCSDDATDTADGADASTTTVASAASGGDNEAFCAAGETINTKTSSIASPEQAVEVFTELDPTLDTMLSTAPDAVADAAETFVTTARASVSSGDFTPFEDGTIDALVERFEVVCTPG